jgi:4'-phosphopantetheinyl transferase EntD
MISCIPGNLRNELLNKLKCDTRSVSVQQPHIRGCREDEKRSLFEVNEHFCPTDNKVDGADERLTRSNIKFQALPVKDYSYNLYNQEKIYIQNAYPKRLQEFSTGRMCGRDVLKELGYNYFPIRKADSGKPVWPPGITGSISHTRQYALACAAKKSDLKGLGIDIEVCESRFPEDVLNCFCTEEEKVHLQKRTAEIRSYESYMLFSKKEAVFKCLAETYNSNATLMKLFQKESLSSIVNEYNLHLICFSLTDENRSHVYRSDVTTFVVAVCFKEL